MLGAENAIAGRRFRNGSINEITRATCTTTRLKRKSAATVIADPSQQREALVLEMTIIREDRVNFLIASDDDTCTVNET